MSRKELFVTSKLTFGSDFGNGTRAAIMNQLVRTRAGYFDLYLLHSFHGNKEQNVLAWQVLEQMYQEGLLKAIGLSNVEVHQIKWLMKRTTIPPHVIQNPGTLIYPGHEFFFLPDIFEFARKEGIIIQSYSTLSGTLGSVPLAAPAKDPHVKEIALQLHCTPAEVLLSWALHMGGAVVTMSLSDDHMHQALQSVNVTLDGTKLAYLNMVTQMHYAQRDARSPHGDFECGSVCSKASEHKYVHLIAPADANRLRKVASLEEL